MFVVLSKPNCSDIAMHIEAIRLLTENPMKALQAARDAMTDEDVVFMAGVSIFDLPVEEKLTLRHYTSRKGSEKEQNPSLVFVAWRNPSDQDRWVERFRQGFVDYPRLTELPMGGNFKASPGKFRVVIILDSEPNQVGNEVGTIAEAIALRDRIPIGCLPLIFDDQGRRAESSPELAAREQAGSLQGR